MLKNPLVCSKSWLKRISLMRVAPDAPDWTNENRSDPGVTLAQLFPWLAGTLLFAVGLRAFLTRRRGRRPGRP